MPSTAKREGLCQLSDDVMIYFEEVMSALCSEAGRVYGGVTLVATGRTTVDLDRPRNRMCAWQRHQVYRAEYENVCDVSCSSWELKKKKTVTQVGGVFKTASASVARKIFPSVKWVFVPVFKCHLNPRLRL